MQGCTQAESRAFILQQFLRLIGASEAPWANNSLSGLKPIIIRETNTATIPAPDGPSGLDGGVTTTFIHTFHD